jgi:hypothetical protein
MSWPSSPVRRDGQLVACKVARGSRVVDQLPDYTVVEIADCVCAADLIAEYQHLAGLLAAAPSFENFGDLAMLCAVAIARVQTLERDAGTSPLADGA